MDINDSNNTNTPKVPDREYSLHLSGRITKFTLSDFLYWNDSYPGYINILNDINWFSLKVTKSPKILEWIIALIRSSLGYCQKGTQKNSWTWNSQEERFLELQAHLRYDFKSLVEESANSFAEISSSTNSKVREILLQRHSILSQVPPVQVVTPAKLAYKYKNYELKELTTAHHLEEESDLSGNCIHENPTYAHKLQSWKIRIFSLRQFDIFANTITLVIDSVSKKILEMETNHIGWHGLRMRNITQEDIDALHECMDKIWFTHLFNRKSPPKIYCEEWDICSVDKETGKFKIEAYSSEKLKNNNVIRGTIVCHQDMDEKEFIDLCKTPWLTLICTDIPQEYKDKITAIKWTLIDESLDISYPKLVRIWWSAIFNMADRLDIPSLMIIVNDLRVPLLEDLIAPELIEVRHLYVDLAQTIILESLTRVWIMIAINAKDIRLPELLSIDSIHCESIDVIQPKKDIYTYAFNREPRDI